MSAQVHDLGQRARALKPGVAGSLAKGVLPLLVGLALAVGMQAGLKPHIDPYYAKLLLDIGVAITLAVSLNIVNGFTGQFSMGHAGFLAVGGYAAGMVTYYGSIRMWESPSMNGGSLSGMTEAAASAEHWFGSGDVLFVCALLVGGLVAALVGVAVGLPSLRLKGDYLAIVTLGFGEIVRVCVQQTGPILKPTTLDDESSPLHGKLVYEFVVRDADGNSSTIHQAVGATPAWDVMSHVGGALGFTGIPKYTSLFWVYLAAAITLIVAFRLKMSTFGRAFLSIREDEIAAEAMGVNTTRYKVWAFVIAAFFAGIAGGLYAHTLGVGLSAESAGFQKSFDVIIMVVLGGLGSISGAVLAAVVVTLLPEWLRGVAEYRMIIYALALILMMIFRPQGLLGVHEIWEKKAWTWLTRYFKKGGVPGASAGSGKA